MNIYGLPEDVRMELIFGRRINLSEPDLHRVYLELFGADDLEFNLVVVDQPGECLVCLERKRITKRQCCDFPVCRDCLRKYYNALISEGIVKISCIGSTCKEYVTQDELVVFLDSDMRQRFRKFMVDANQDPSRKTCPRCNHITDLDPTASLDPRTKKMGVQVMCPECQLLWCFTCQSPWHESQSCKDFQKGDMLFRKWTKQRPDQQVRNAQKCPKCKIFIQRSSGCDHMTCCRCSTEFCYLCGEKYRNMKFIGNHRSRLSIFGCKYRFKPEKPVTRRLIRGSIFGGKLLIAPIVGGLALGAGIIVLGVGLVALPFYGGYKLHKMVQLKKKEKKQRMCATNYLSILREIEARESQAAASAVSSVQLDCNSVVFLQVPELPFADDETVDDSDEFFFEVHSIEPDYESTDSEENYSSRASVQISASSVCDQETASNLFSALIDKFDSCSVGKFGSCCVDEVIDSETATDTESQDDASAKDRNSVEVGTEMMQNPAESCANSSKMSTTRQKHSPRQSGRSIEVHSHKTLEKQSVSVTKPSRQTSNRLKQSTDSCGSAAGNGEYVAPCDMVTRL